MRSNRAETVAYYEAVSTRLLPYLKDRPVALVIGDDHSLMQRLDGDPIRLESPTDIVERVEGGTVAFLAGPVSWEGEVWFSVGLQAPGAPFEVTRLTALKLHLVLTETDINALMYYDGAGAVRFLWSWGVADPHELVDGIWEFQHRIARTLRHLVEKRLEGTPERVRIGRWLGYEGEVTRSVPPRITGSRRRGSSTETAGSDRVQFEFRAMESTGLMRVPFSLHESTGAAARPVSQADLYRFRPGRDATPSSARRLRRSFEIPINFPRTVSRDLSIQEGE